MTNDYGHPADADGLSQVEPVPVSPVPASIPDADDEAFNDLMGSISRVYSLREGHTLTQEDFDAIQHYDKHFRDEENNAVEAFHLGYMQGLREGGSADIEQMKERLDARGSELAVAKAMRGFAETRLVDVESEFLQVAAQYRDDLKFPPTGDSLERRLKAVVSIIAKAMEAQRAETQSGSVHDSAVSEGNLP